MTPTETFAPTPIRRAEALYQGRSLTFGLKLESENTTGSIKDRTAVGLFIAMERESPLTPGSVVVESTSGNLGLALASLLRQIDCRFIAVIDPRTPEAIRRRLSELDAESVMVDDPDEHGGYLLSRLREVRRLCSDNPAYRWPNQYGNPANPDIHARTTGPEISRQDGPSCNTAYIAVSTGGTLAGVSAYLRRHRPGDACT